MGKLILREADGASLGVTDPTYEQCHFDEMMRAVTSRQDLHLAQFFKILDLMGFPSVNRLMHLTYRLASGVSTRKGTPVFLDQIIKEASSVVCEKMRRKQRKAKRH